MEVDVRKRNDTEKIIKTLPTNYDMYFWVFTGASNLVHCEFDTSSLRSKRIVSQSNASNVNVSYADSPFGWMYSNLVIYNTSRENSGIYTCLNENNDTNSFELIFGLDYEDNASPGFDFYTKLLLVLGLSYVFWSI
ncbi:hypothetical protein L596_004429 [Steinernema carpocapsae]|uniref:Ig-like domain-containing protein n=1 Tax=Steinernema carpocapsae TaxID=34508 RepID=A0A4U8UXA8_STECR|nr:hypothetical protein L596_004429 [Steinernema carpocapsae]